MKANKSMEPEDPFAEQEVSSQPTYIAEVCSKEIIITQCISKK